MKYAWITEHSRDYSIVALSRFMDVSRSCYYDWLNSPKTDREKENEVLTEQLKKLFEDSRKTYGTRRLKRKLADKGIHISRRRIGRLMRKTGLFCKTKRRFKATTNSKHNKPIAPNLLARQFKVSQPDRYYVGDNDSGHPIAMNMNVLKGFRLTEISRWSKQHLQSGSLVVSDGLACFTAVKEAGCLHEKIVTGGGFQSVTKEEFTWVNTMIGNVKNAITGTYHAIKLQHLPRYLAEFCYRFNRRFQLEDMLPRFAYVAVRTPPMSNKLLKMAESYG